MKPFEWVSAASVAEAIELLAAPSTMAKAGGVDLLDRMKEGLEAPARLVSLAQIADLDRLHDDGGLLRIGALVTLARLADDPAVRARWPALADAAGHAATPQIRNMATLGGNLAQRPRCWYYRSLEHNCRRKSGEECFAIADGGENQYHALFDNKLCAMVHPSTPATALVALGARVAIASQKGEREIALEDLFVTPSHDLHHENGLAQNELITEIRVPAPTGNTRSAYIKQGAKESYDWPIVDVAVVLELSLGVCKRASIVLGAVAPVPHRATAAESALVGRTVGKEVAQAAAKAALEHAAPLSGNAYKIPIAQTVLRRAILAAAGVAS